MFAHGHRLAERDAVAVDPDGIFGVGDDDVAGGIGDGQRERRGIDADGERRGGETVGGGRHLRMARADLKLGAGFKICKEQQTTPYYYLVNDVGVAYRMRRGDDTVESVLAMYEESCDRARAVVEHTESLDALSTDPHHVWGQVTLRWVILHMLEETARHAGHLDLMREQIDGKTG